MSHGIMAFKRRNVFQLPFLRLAGFCIREQPDGCLGHEAAKGQKDQRGYNIKRGVNVGYLCHRIASQRLHKGYERCCHADAGKDQRAYDVKQQMDHCGTLCVDFCADGSQDSGNASADILSEQDIDSAG